MNILIIRNNAADVKSFKLSSVLVFVIIIFLVTLGIYRYFTSSPILLANSSSDDSAQIIQLIHQQQQQIKDTKVRIDQQLDNFVLKLAKVQAQLIQLDNVGEKLVKLSKLNKKEFNFSPINSIGGPAQLIDVKQISIEQRLSEIKHELTLKSQQLYAIEALYDDKLYRDKVIPKGKPAEKGWLSSYFGKRKDPFTGKMSQHKGVDIAGKIDTHIIATASGMVSWAKKRSGYGNLVEITHGNGLVTRYGHCKKILVKQGQKINQGDKIATIGSTGRSTGPHVHYEVIKNGVKINPIGYIRKKRNDNTKGAFIL